MTDLNLTNKSDRTSSTASAAPRATGALTPEWTAINTIRTLAIDAIQKANSGHPGAPMALAPLAYVLWNERLRYDTHDAQWIARDRFVLSAGHASMLLYALLHLAEVKELGKDGKPDGQAAISLDDIKSFRQSKSKCAGHPEYRLATGIEATTGPLGQGAANSVGMAIAQRFLQAQDPALKDVMEYNVYTIASDGCMMEGVTSEAASIAGHLKLDRLCWIYDSNRVSLEGPTSTTFTEDTGARFRAYGWHVVEVADANDLGQIRQAFAAFDAVHDRPTLILLHSHIGYGSPHKQDTKDAHGEALGADEVKLVKANYQWPQDQFFLVPEEARTQFRQGIVQRGQKLRTEWNAQMARLQQTQPKAAEKLELLHRRHLPQDWDASLPNFPADSKGLATRESSGKVLNAIAEKVPWLLGGSADLNPSTKTKLVFNEAGDFEPETPAGRNLHFGVREHAMGAITNGLALSGLRPFQAGFFIFTDYERAPIRLSSLMELGVIHIFTHDSIGLGEDGPTHQPIEQLASLRAIPGMMVFRPADANEVVEAWRVIMNLHEKPAMLVLSRQALPTLDRNAVAPAHGVSRGGYVLKENFPSEAPELLMIATGSEVHLALKALDKLKESGVRARVVSLPCWELFEEQSEEYRESVLPLAVSARISIEAASKFGWERYVGLHGKAIGMSGFGASAPIADLMEEFGFTVEKIEEQALALLKRRGV